MFNMTKPKIEQEEDYDEFDWIKTLEEAEKRIDEEIKITPDKYGADKLRTAKQILKDCFRVRK